MDGVVDLDREEVVRDGAAVALTTLEARLLAYLVRHQGRDVSREELHVEVWGYHPDVVTRAADNTMRRLRTKLEVDPKNPSHLLKVHGVGYRFVPAPRDSEPGGVQRGFVGRRRELAAIESAFDGGARWVTLHGPGGAGKTRLARRALVRLRGDGVFVPLGAAATTARFRTAVARALGQPSAGREAEVEARIDEALGERATLVLDELEPLLATAAREEVLARLAGWLDRHPRLRLLVTSREATGDPREAVVEVGPLDELDALSLLAERITDAGGEALPTEDALAVVRRAEGLPLTLEVVASALAEDPDQVASTVRSGRFGPRATGVFEASYQRLSQEEAATYRRLSVIAGSCDPELAEAVAGSGAPAALESLRRKSMLVRDPDGRHRMLTPVRAHAQAALDRAGERDVVERAHAEAVLERAGPRVELEEVIERFLRDPDPARRSLGLRATLALEPELRASATVEEHRAALDAALGAAAGQPEEEALRLRRALQRARTNAIEGALDDLARVPGREDLVGARALVEATVHRARRDLDDAVAVLDAALARGARVPAEERAQLLRARGALAAERGQPEEALPRYQEAAELTSDPYLALGLHVDRANALTDVGELEEARTEFLRALDAADALGDRRREGIVLANLGALEHQAGRLSEARAHLRDAERLCRRLGMRRFHAFALGGLAFLDHEEGHLVDAAERVERAIVLYREVGDDIFGAVALGRRGALEAEQGREDRAREDFARARELGGAIGWCREGIAVLERSLDDSPLPPVETSTGRMAARVVEAIRARRG